MHEPKLPVIEPYKFSFNLRRFLIHCTIMGICVLLGLMTWYFGKPDSIRLYETTAENPLAATLAPGIDMALDASSFVAVKESQPLQAELFKGNVYFGINKNATDQLEVKVGNALIKGSGTRCSIQMHKDGNHQIAVAEGHVQIHTASGIHQINASEQAEINHASISNHQLIIDQNIAPWYPQQ